MSAFTESVVEDAALAWLEAVGWQVAHGPEIAPGMSTAERTDYGEVILAGRLREALARFNPELPAEALEDAFRKLTRSELAAAPAAAAQAGGADLVQRSRDPKFCRYWAAESAPETDVEGICDQWEGTTKPGNEGANE